MENRKSFIIHYDSLDVIDDMSDEEVWRLFRKMKSYHNWNTYVSGDKIADIAFSAFKNQFDRDLERYDNTCERNRRNGLKWGRPQVTQDNPKEPTGLSGLQKEPKEPYSKSKSKSDSKNDNDNNSNSNIIISSKEDRQVTEKKEYWDPIINSIIETIKFHNNWIIDGTIPSNRKHGKMLRDKIWKITGFNWDYINFLSTLIERTDQYNIAKTTSCESIYYNLALLVAKIKTTHIETVKKEEDQKPKVWSNRNTNSLTTT